MEARGFAISARLAPLSLLLTGFRALLPSEAIDPLEIDKPPLFTKPDGDPTIRRRRRMRHCAAKPWGQLTLYGFWS